MDIEYSVGILKILKVSNIRHRKLSWSFLHSSFINKKRLKGSMLRNLVRSSLFADWYFSELICLIGILIRKIGGILSIISSDSSSILEDVMSSNILMNRSLVFFGRLGRGLNQLDFRSSLSIS